MTTKMSALSAYRTGRLALPCGYDVEHGAGVLLLRRDNGSVVATFAAANTPPAEVVRVAERDFRGKVRSHF